MVTSKRVAMIFLCLYVLNLILLNWNSVVELEGRARHKVGTYLLIYSKTRSDMYTKHRELAYKLFGCHYPNSKPMECLPHGISQWLNQQKGTQIIPQIAGSTTSEFDLQSWVTDLTAITT